MAWSSSANAAALVGLLFTVYGLMAREAGRAERSRRLRLKAIGTLVELLCSLCGGIAIAVLLDWSGAVQPRLLDAALTTVLVAVALIVVDHLDETCDSTKPGDEDLAQQDSHLAGEEETLAKLTKGGSASTACAWVVLAAVAPILIEVVFRSAGRMRASVLAEEGLTIVVAGVAAVGALVLAFVVRIGAVNRWTGQQRVGYGVAAATALLIATALA